MTTSQNNNFNGPTHSLFRGFKTIYSRFTKAVDNSEIRFVVILFCYIIFYGFYLFLQKRGWQPVILAPMMAEYSLHIGSTMDHYLFRVPHYIDGTCLQFLKPLDFQGEWNPTQHSFCVTSGCSAAMQLWLFWSWILWGKGSWQRKLCYLPFSACVILLFNGIRIGLLGWIIVHAEPCFNLFHDKILSILIPIVMFGLWIQAQSFCETKTEISA